MTKFHKYQYRGREKWIMPKLFLHPPPRGSTEVTRSQRAHSRLHERIPCSGTNQQQRQCMELPNTESNTTGLIGCLRMPTLGHGRDAICRRPQELWRNPPPSRTSVPTRTPQGVHPSSNPV